MACRTKASNVRQNRTYVRMGFYIILFITIKINEQWRVLLKVYVFWIYAEAHVPTNFVPPPIIIDFVNEPLKIISGKQLSV